MIAEDDLSYLRESLSHFRREVTRILKHLDCVWDLIGSYHCILNHLNFRGIDFFDEVKQPLAFTAEPIEGSEGEHKF